MVVAAVRRRGQLRALTMTVRIISRDNGVGLGRDLQLVAYVLRTAGVDVETLGFGSDK